MEDLHSLTAIRRPHRDSYMVERKCCALHGIAAVEAASATQQRARGMERTDIKTGVLSVQFTFYDAKKREMKPEGGSFSIFLPRV